MRLLPMEQVRLIGAYTTVNPKMFARILFYANRIKTHNFNVEIRNKGVIYLYM